MPDAPSLRPATPAEIADALSFALQYQGQKHVHQADGMMARITADRLVRHLRASGFVLMKSAPATALSTSRMLSSAERDPVRDVRRSEWDAGDDERRSSMVKHRFIDIVAA